MRDRDDEAALLLELAQALHAVAVPADEVEERVRAAAHAFGLEAQVFTMQSLALTQVEDDGDRRVDMRRVPFDTHWNLRRLDDYLEIARGIAQRRLSVSEARGALAQVGAMPNHYRKWVVVLAYAIYGAAVAARVGGAWLEMLAAGLIGVVTGAIHFGTLRSQTVDLQKSFLASLCGLLAAFPLAFVLPPFDVGRAVFGGIALLVPAMVIAIGIHELANEALESGTVRLSYGLLRFLMLGAGAAGALTVARLIAAWPASATVSPLPGAVVLAAVAVGGVALTVCLQAPRRDVPWICGAALLAHGTQELTKLLVGGRGSPLVAAVLVGVAGNLFAQRTRRPAGIIVVPGLLQLAPGFLGTTAVFGLLRGTSVSGASFFEVLLVALQLGLGLLVAGVLFPRREGRA
jgi:uncharacterized membrane protein YjjP (DUF1212 family)